MRGVTSRTIAGLCAVAILALALTRDETVQVAHADAAQVLILGDSLAVGMKDFLAEMIVDREVTFESATAGRRRAACSDCAWTCGATPRRRSS